MSNDSGRRPVILGINGWAIMVTPGYLIALADSPNVPAESNNEEVK